MSTKRLLQKKTSYDVTIVGSGVHGCILATTLLHHHPSLHLRIIDPYKPLFLWKKRMQSCAVSFLRSPASHSLSPDFRSLLLFSQERGYTKKDFLHPYWRPSWKLFEDHSEYILSKYHLEDYRYRETVKSFYPERGGWRIVTNTDSLHTKILILALGSPFKGPEGMMHVLDPHFGPKKLKNKRVIVLGSGLSGLQVALAMADLSTNPVSIIERSPPTIHYFDSNPCYIGPRCQPLFLCEKDSEKRHVISDKAKYPGSIPPDYRRFRRDSRLRIHQAEISGMNKNELICRDGRHFKADVFISATGFTQNPRDIPLVDWAIRKHDLSVSSRNFPILNNNLEWREGLYVSGFLAELGVGPPCRNIIGAHLVARRIIQSIS